MAISTDHFERAMQNTLLKVTRIVSSAECSSAISYEYCDEEEDQDKVTDLVLAFEEENIPEKELTGVISDTENRVSAFSYAASALREMESVKKVDLRV